VRGGGHDDYVEIVKASEFRLEEWEEELRKRIEDDVNDKRIAASEETEATTAATQPTDSANLTDNAL